MNKFHYVLLLSFVAIILSSTVSFSHADYMSPKKQLESGVLPEDVICREDKVLVIRDNGNPACVREFTADKMNWKVIEQTSIDLSSSEQQSLYDDSTTVLVKSDGVFEPKDKPFGAYSEILSTQRTPSPETYEQSTVDKIIEIQGSHVQQEKLANDLGVSVKSLSPENHRGFIVNNWIPTKIPTGYELKVATWSGPFEGPISTIERMNLSYTPSEILLTSQNYTKTVLDVQGFSISGTYLISLPWTDVEIQNYINKLLSYGAWEETSIHDKRAVMADLTDEHRAAIKIITSDYEFDITSFYHTSAELIDIIKSVPALQ